MHDLPAFLSEVLLQSCTTQRDEGMIEFYYSRVYNEDPHAYKLNYLEGVGHHSIISRGGKSGDMYNEFIVK
jgi:hypothetical protein